MRPFDRKFGAEFLASVPTTPGIYRFFDPEGALLYVGKAANLRRRLAQYRTAGRRKKERKRRALVKAAGTIAWEVSESALAATLTEIRLIQSLRPPQNVASAFPFLYPYVGIHAEGDETYFCLTTSPAAFPAFAFHGAFRSRDVTAEAFFSLMRLLRFPGHPVPRHRCRRLGSAPYSHVMGLRRLPAEAPAAWARLFAGVSREPLEALTLELLDHPGARARRAEIHEDLKAVARFFKTEARALARVRAATGYERYPVPQEDRDLIFARGRQVESSR
jgi:GIY-YIG catalytic domain-containing protein